MQLEVALLLPSLLGLYAAWRGPQPQQQQQQPLLLPLLRASWRLDSTHVSKTPGWCCFIAGRMSLTIMSSSSLGSRPATSPAGRGQGEGRGGSAAGGAYVHVGGGWTGGKEGAVESARWQPARPPARPNWLPA